MIDRTIIGQHLFAGFAGDSIDDDFKRYIHSHKIGNVILFSYNVKSKFQLKALCADIKRLILDETGIEPYIAIDQEGGVVSRLSEDCAIFPSAMAVSACADERRAYLAGLYTARELLAMGVNFNLAPVLDVNSNPLNPVIGVRSYSDSPTTVALYGIATMKGLSDGGVMTALKHFPGHGDTNVDSHIGLAKVDKTLEELEKCELAPYKAAIKAGARAVMTTHILFPRVESDAVPATMSRRIITGVLKERLGFSGLVISDCMMMGAIADYYGTVNGCVSAIKAGVDMVFTSHSAKIASEVIEAVEREIITGGVNKNEFSQSTDKILKYKKAVGDRHADINEVGCLEHRALSQEISRAAMTIVNDAPFSLGEKPMFIGPYRFRPSLADSPDDKSLSFANEMSKRLGGGAIVSSRDPDRAEINEILDKCRNCDCVVVGLYFARGNQGQRELINALAREKNVMAVALRNPYDLWDLPSAVRSIAAYDYDARTMPVIASAIAGETESTGKLPVRLG